MKFILAIDGTVASGKGSISQVLAKHFGFSYLDTGLLYRFVAHKLLKNNEALETDQKKIAIMIAKNLVIEEIEPNFLRTEEIGNLASDISKIAELRTELLSFQRNFAEQEGGAVLDGRDIGTVVCPNADVKVFVTAKPDIRAKRRYLQIKRVNPKISYHEILKNLTARDKNDTKREIAPMKIAEDALLLDTSELSIDSAVKIIIEKVNDRLKLMN